MAKVKVKEKEFTVDDNYAALTEAIKALTQEIRRLADK